MKKLCRIIGTMALGMALLTGCGEEQTGGGLILEPAATGSSDTEGQRQNNQEQSSQGQSAQGQTILTLGTYDTDGGLNRAVEAYNAKNGKYKVEIVNYDQENMDPDMVRERFKMDLATGKGTDIVWICDMAADELGYAGALADMNVFLTPETKKKYLTNILDYAQTGDALYEIAATFSIGFIAGNSEKMGTETGWTMEQMLQVFRANNKDANALGNVGVNTAQELVRYAIEDFVDWDAGKADFCNQEFYDILEFCKNESGWVRATQETVVSGKHLAVQGSLGEVTDIQYMDWLFGGDWMVKGWPSNQGTGVNVAFWNSFAISSYSQCPEGAWDFIEYYMTLDWLEDYTVLHPDIPAKTYQSIHGLPVNRQTFEKMMDWSMTELINDEGELVPHYFGENGVPDFYANSAEDVERIREIVTLVDRKTLSNLSYVCQIIGEEVGGYKTGALSAEKTAEKIQNRVQLYLDEQKYGRSLNCYKIYKPFLDFCAFI